MTSSAQREREARQGLQIAHGPVIWCALFFIAALLCIFYLINSAAERANHQAAENARHLMKTALSVVSSDMRGRLVDYAWWDDMVRQYHAGIDPDWAADNIGEYLQEDFSYAGTFIVGPDHKTVFVDNADTEMKPDFLTAFGSGASEFLIAVQKTGMEKSFPVSTYFRVGNRIHIVAAAPISPEDPTERQLEWHPRPVLIFHRILDQSLLSGISERYLLPQAHLHFRETPEGLNLSGASGEVVAAVEWQQPKPGDLLMDDMLPKMLLVALMLLLATLAIYIMWSKSALTALATKAQFLAKMSHELRTPLNPIIGFSEMMSKEMLGPLSPSYRQYAHDILISGRHMQGLVEDLLDLSNFESNAFSLNEAEIDVAQLLDEVSEISQLNCAKRGGGNATAMLKQEIQDNLPMLKADPLRIRQVLINLLTNAAKFSGDKEIVLRAFADHGAICIDVADQGCGIAAADIQRAFEPMVQLSNGSDSRNPSGIGLGLSISRELMRLHGGTLELESSPGRGTTAMIRFPKDRTGAIPRLQTA